MPWVHPRAERMARARPNGESLESRDMRSCSSLRKTNDPLGRETVSVSAGRLEPSSSTVKRKKRKKRRRRGEEEAWGGFLSLSLLSRERAPSGRRTRSLDPVPLRY